MIAPKSLHPIAALFAACTFALAQQAESLQHPWMDPGRPPGERAEMVLKQLTLDQKIQLLHGNGMPGWGKPRPNAYLGNGGAGFVLGFPELGIPIIQMSDAAYGVRSSAENGRYSTALPSNLAAASSWDPQAACEYGALIGRELRAQGYNMTLGGGVNITRDPRNGRTFEYQGEDPILAGTLVGHRIQCEQAQYVIGDIKHYAVNDQESGRNEVNSVIGKRALRESDLLAFQIGIRIGNPQAVMCSYNAVNGDFACQNKYLLTDVLKRDWKFRGFVLSDWGGTHSTAKASAAGLDNEEPEDLFYGPSLKDAVQSGKVPMSEIDDHARRVLEAEFASGIVDHPMQRSVVDVQAGLNTALHLEEQSIVLLKNNGVLPLDHNQIRSIAIIGSHADEGMISGGGSAQVDAPGRPTAGWQAHVWYPSSPLRAIRSKLPAARILFDPGVEPAAAAAVAKQADVALVFAYQWTSEGMDLPSLTLPDNQDALIDAVAAANPRTIVVLETGTACLMPWIDRAAGILEAWYGGSKGGDAVANILFGNVNPSAKLAMTFPLSDADLPHPKLITPPPGATGREAVQRTGEAKPTFSVSYDEGLKVGYKWYDAENKPVLFPFGFGLSYTTYAYSGLKLDGAEPTSVGFTVTNTGPRAGAEIAQVYVALPASAGEPPKRLVGWSKVRLDPNESKFVEVSIRPEYLEIYDEASDSWKRPAGEYRLMVGRSSKDLPLQQTMTLR